LKVDGSLWAWGNNAAGQLGDGTGSQRTAPVVVGQNFVAVAANMAERTSRGLRDDGSLWAWGSNSFSQLGDGTTATRLAPVFAGTGYLGIAAGVARSFGLKSGGSLWAWGGNAAGQLGDGTGINRPSPVLVGTNFLMVAAAEYFTVGLKADGSLWSWGGIQTQIGSGYIAIAAGSDYGLAIKNDGSLWAWGTNSYGQLGDGTTTNRTSPVQVGTGFVAVSAGFSHSLGLKGDGSLWAWGFNNYGQVGDGSTANRLSPVQVGTGYLAVAGGGYHTLAIKQDGSVWAWGFNSSGQLGDGTVTTYRPLPVQVVGLGTSALTKNLTVTTSGNGAVSSTPGGIDCGTSCVSGFAVGTQVTLTATPANGYAFSGWSGACSGTAACAVTMDTAKTVGASFIAITSASVALSNLAFTYDGTQKSAVCQSTPSGLATSISYSDLGSGTARSNAGSYGVSCTVTQLGYSGSTSGVLVISAQTNSISAVLGVGWNLAGNGSTAPLDVAATLGDPAKVVSVWKWIPTLKKWAFYTPVLAGQPLADYAASKGYEVLTAIEGGEGFWVNAKAAITVSLPAGNLTQSSDFMPAVADPATPGGPRALSHGWSLIATGDKPTPAQFDSAIATVYSTPPTVGQVYVNLTTLWAWDATRARWYFWAPALVNDGGLTSYIGNKGYLDFATLPGTPTGTLSPTTGFWVNMP
jgi:alpha-tubulin suppressor-like RCC1 family protein